MSRQASIDRRAEAKAKQSSSSSSSSSSSGRSSSNPDEFKYSFGGTSYENKADATAASRSSKASSSGIVTSDSASRSVDQARNDLNTIGSTSGATSSGGQSDQLSALFEQLSSLRDQLGTAKENEKLQREKATDIELDTKLSTTSSSEEAGDTKETDLSRSIQAINTGANGGQADTSGIENPVVAAMTQTTLNNLSLIEQQATRLNDFAKTMSEYSQAEVNDINATAMRAVERQIAENSRVQRALEFAGVRAGRAQIAPRVEGTLIHEIVQEGLDKINEIEDKKTTAIRAARKAESEFNYKLFTDSVQLAKDYNQEIEDSVTALKAEVRQAEKDEQDRLEFAQGQEERSALILAGELIDATPEQIAEAAIANGIDPSLLNKAVSDAKFEAEDREFQTADNALSLEQKRESILSSQNSRRLANEAAARAAAGEDDDGFDETDSALLRQAGLEDASKDEKIAFLDLSQAKRNEVIKKHQESLEEEENTSLDSVISEVVGDQTWANFIAKDGMDDKFKAAAAEMGINPAGWRNKKEAENFLKIVVQNAKDRDPSIKDSEIKAFLRDIPEDATVEEITTYINFLRNGA
jgi:hypothetical protein